MHTSTHVGRNGCNGGCCYTWRSVRVACRTYGGVPQKREDARMEGGKDAMKQRRKESVRVRAVCVAVVACC